MPRMILLGGFLLLIVYTFSAQPDGVEAIEIGKHNVQLLPGGKEADGIIGDFVLRNEKIQMLVAGNQHLRRPNMTVEKGFVTPGCLYDLDLIGESNDQITIFRPGELGGLLSSVHISNPGRRGVASIVAVRSAVKGDGLYTKHEYQLLPNQQYITVTSTYRNQFGGKTTIKPQAVWKEFSQRWTIGNIQVGDSIDPFDKRAYAWAALDPSRRKGQSARLLSSLLPKELELSAGEQKVFVVALAVNRSPLAAYGILESLGEEAGEVVGHAAGPNEQSAIHASIQVVVKGQKLPAYPDD